MPFFFAGSACATRTGLAATAFLMTTMLADVINSGTAWPARRVGFTLPAAGKTGTTNDYRAAWFVGFTPRLVSGVRAPASACRGSRRRTHDTRDLV